MEPSPPTTIIDDGQSLVQAVVIDSSSNTSAPLASATSLLILVGGTFAFLKCPAVGLFDFAGVSSTKPSCTAS